MSSISKSAEQAGAQAPADAQAPKTYAVEFSAIWTYRFEVVAANEASAYDEAARQYYAMDQEERALETDAFELEYIDAEEVQS